MNIFIFLGIVFLITFVLGHVLEKIRIPWIFSTLLLGVALSLHNPFTSITQSAPFALMSQIGLYLLLFIIGFELNIPKLIKSGKFIITATFTIEISEMIFIGTLLHFLFSLSWPIAFILALSFATIGEAILLPMLEEFKMVKTKLGQMILGIATFDDVFEIFVLLGIIFLAPYFINSTSPQTTDPLLIPSLLMFAGLLIFILFTVKKLKKEVSLMKVPDIAAVLPLVFAVFFIFVGIDGSEGIHLAVLGALFAGMITKALLPTHYIEEVEPQIKTITYGLFAPIFFLQIGLETNAEYLFSNFWIIILIVVVAKTVKILSSYLIGKKELGSRKSIFMGVALGVRFSTSIVFLKLLLDSHIITNNIYSIMIGTSILFKFIVPLVLAALVKKWHLGQHTANHQIQA